MKLKITQQTWKLWAHAAALASGISVTGVALSQTAKPSTPAARPAAACAHQGELDKIYCDADRNLLADAPANSTNPAKIVMAISSVEDAAIARKTYIPLMDSLSTCLKRDVELYPPVREGAVLEGQRNGTVHIGQYSTGATMYAVNYAGAIPFAGKGKDSEGRSDSYTLRLIVRADSAFKKPQDLKGRKLAHTSATSNSGNLAPRALFPELGLKPEVDYQVEFSGGHDKSIQGVKLGLYDAAAIASDVMLRVIARGDAKASDFRILYESEPFPTDAFAMSHHLDPKLQAQIRKCFLDFKFPDTMSRVLENNNRFFPLEYRRDWQLVCLSARLPKDCGKALRQI
jgi:phosphonate transport system substrate-binding protein